MHPHRTVSWVRLLALALGLPLMYFHPATGVVRAQFRINPDQPDFKIDAAQRTQAVEGVLKELDQNYVFPDVAKQMNQAIRKRIDNKEYDGITSAAELTKTLTEHLREVCKDKHLRVIFSAEPLPEPRTTPPTREERENMRKMAAARNYGFQKVERLDGNVGYLKLDGFNPPELAGDTAAAAMNFLNNTDSLIIDLRQNGGGSPGMVALVCSYLFGPQPVHLNDLYFRPEDKTHQWWTLPYLPGPRYLDKDVYILTSNRTFSAAEEFTYNLKNLKRATVVGETTGGGAHPVNGRRVNEHFLVVVPVGRAINPITKTNWEGTGVKPDVEVPADQALKTAYLAALKKHAEKYTDKRAVEEIQRAIKATEGELEEMKKKAK